MPNESGMRVKPRSHTPKLRGRNEDTFIFSESQLSEFMGEYYEHITENRLPGWISTTWAISAPVFAFFSQYIITKADYKQILFLPAELIETLCISLAIVSGACIIICAVGWFRHHLREDEAITRRSAVKWGKKTAKAYCCDVTPIGNNQVPFDPNAS